MDAWEWFSSTASVDSLLTTLGLGTLALLFARDLILTRDQHLRRVQDLVAHHARELSEKDARLADAHAARDEWKAAAQLHRDRADKATAAVGDMAASLTGIQHVLESLDRALPGPVGGRNDRS